MSLYINIDSIFFEAVNILRGLPSISITLMSALFCSASVILIKKYFGYIGLCCCMGLFSIIGNIQVLYATTYEILNMKALLGTVTLSASFMVSDIVNKHYGSDKAKTSVFIGFVMQILFFNNILLTIGHKPLFSFVEISKSMEKIFLPIPRLLIASYIAYLASQLSEIWFYKSIDRIQIIKNHYVKHNLILFLSSVVIDTAVFTTIGLVILTETPLSYVDFQHVFFSACIVRIFCNFINSLTVKVL
jgi:uncharacterized integral membrane protein (TIGR00697 family)